MENYDSMNDISVETALQDLRYLQLLSKQFPTISDACTEIINLEAILNLPKGTEHFLTDIHGEYEAFQHVLKLPLIQISEPTRQAENSYAVFCLKKKKIKNDIL